MSKLIDLTGNRYSRLLVLNETTPRVKPIKWVCLCDCGNIKEIQGAALKNGATKSCGCLHIERNKQMFGKHGEIHTKLYAVHQAMLRRCNTPTHKSYCDYGGRGITICNEWFDYLVFKDWANKSGYAEGLSIDRKDNDGNYDSENCRWVSQMIQTRNRRPLKGGSSNYIGVHWDTQRAKWFASISVNTKYIALGRFDSEIEAAQTRDNYIINNNLTDFVLNFKKE